MEIVRIIRVLRRRWRLVLLVTLVGAVLGALPAIRVANEDDPVVLVFYDVRQTLLVADDSEAGLNLQQAAFLTTIGSIPDRVGADLGGDPDVLASQIQTVTNPNLRTITVSGVADTPDEATAVTSAFADALIDLLQGENLAAYESRISEVRADVDARSEALEATERDLAALEAQIRGLVAADAAAQARAEAAQGIDPPEETADEPTSNVAEIERLEADLDELETAMRADQTRFDAATEVLESLTAAGAPVPPIDTLDISEPQTVSERERNRRLARGRDGEANYLVGASEIPAGGGGSLLSSSLLDSPPALLAGGSLAGLLLGIVAALLMSRLDHRILTREDAEHHFGMPVLAEVPRLKRSHRKIPLVVSASDPMSPVAEAYRGLRSSLLYARDFGEIAPLDPESETVPGESKSNLGTVVLVTSPGASEGKTSTVANLANVLAEEDYDVLAVNCDFRRPRLAFFLEGDHEPRRLSKTNIDGVRLINHVTAAGFDTRPTAHIRAQKRVIAEARERFDVVLLDTAPLLLTNDTTEILSVVDLVIVVAQVGKTSREGAEATREILERRQTPVAGLVLVGGDSGPRSPGYYYYQSDVGRRSWPTFRLRRRQKRDARFRSRSGRRSKSSSDDDPDRSLDAIEEVQVGP